MKNIKGFTLVEMLAVIALIAVFSVVAVSTYRGINESSKKKALEAKIQQIETAAEKWARENNITNKMSISVNTLVVEGYLSADEVGTDGLAVLRNPVTSENMICNVVELSFKNGDITSHFNGNVYNCKLATQSLIDNNINIKIISASGENLTGSGSIAKWTNEDIVLIVNSNTYDNKAASISYDYAGNTTTKMVDSLEHYTGESYMNETEANKYYNVYYIKSEIILNANVIVTYDIPGEVSKSRAYTIRFDKEEATASLDSNSEWVTLDQKINIKLDDGKGSGSKCFYVTKTETWNEAEAVRYDTSYQSLLNNEDVGKYYIWTEDNAGNRSTTPKLVVDINNIDKVTPDCEVIFTGNEGDHGWYKEVPVTPSVKNITPASISGVNIGINNSSNDPTYSVFAAYGTINEAVAAEVTENTDRNGINYYCHIKSLAGNYTLVERNLKLDMTPPTVNIDIESDRTYTKDKNLTITVSDSLSGINGTGIISYGWGTSENNITYNREIGILARAGSNNPHRLYISGEGFTGIYYLYIDVSRIDDYAGNHANDINGRGAQAVFGPYYFDNTPPSCIIGGVTNQCATGGVACTVSCSDGHSGVYDCPGYQSGLIRDSTFTATDRAGNTSHCTLYVSSTTQYNKQECTGYHKYECNCGWSGWYCYQTDTWESDDSEDVQVGCTGCYDAATCNKSYQCCKRTKVCRTCTDYSKCDYWSGTSPWQNTEISNCSYPDCKVNSRVVYHSGGTCSASNFSGGSGKYTNQES